MGVETWVGASLTVRDGDLKPIRLQCKHVHGYRVCGLKCCEMSGIAEVFARARRRQLRADVFLRRWNVFVCRRRHRNGAACHLLLREWRHFVVMRVLSPLMRVVFQSWRLEADVRIRAMMLLRRWREPRMLQARRRRAARVLIRRSLDEWFMHMLVCRASRGGVTYAFGYWRGYSWQ